jgi:hypothetical protein
VGSLVDLGFLLLAAVVSAIWVHGRFGQSRSLRLLALIMLSGLGLLAFAYSAISPKDDVVQHECIRIGSRLRVLACHASCVSANRNSVRVSATSRIADVADEPRPEGTIEVRLAFLLPVTHHTAALATRAPPLPIYN